MSLADLALIVSIANGCVALVSSLRRLKRPQARGRRSGGGARRPSIQASKRR